MSTGRPSQGLRTRWCSCCSTEGGRTGAEPVVECWNDEFLVAKALADALRGRENWLAHNRDAVRQLEVGGWRSCAGSLLPPTPGLHSAEHRGSWIDTCSPASPVGRSPAALLQRGWCGCCRPGKITSSIRAAVCSSVSLQSVSLQAVSLQQCPHASAAGQHGAQPPAGTVGSVDPPAGSCTGPAAPHRGWGGQL